MAILALKQIEDEEERERTEEDTAKVQAALEKIEAAGSFEAAGYGSDAGAPDLRSAFSAFAVTP